MDTSISDLSPFEVISSPANSQLETHSKGHRMIVVQLTIPRS